MLDFFISIDLSDNKFHGEIPSTIWDLQSLVMLNLSINNFIGFISSSFRNLKQLESLDLSSNKLSGKIPHDKSHLSRIFKLFTKSTCGSNTTGGTGLDI